jgi:hypothetical protein
LKERGDVEKLTEVSDPSRLFDKFMECAKGSVVIDPRVKATINVATAVASVEDLVIVHPDFARQLPWAVKEDLRGRWTSNVDAYRWAYDTYWDKMNHHVLACFYPLRVDSRDYAVAFKIFPFFISGNLEGKAPEANPKAEYQFAKEVLANAPVNIPVMGWEPESTGIGEHNMVRLFSWYGKTVLATNQPGSLTLHSGTKRSEYLNPPMERIELEDSKVYVSFTLTDGDSTHMWYDFNMSRFADPARGTVPINWQVGITPAYDLIPDVIDWYYEKLYGIEMFTCSMGAGYTYPDQFGRAFRDRAAVHEEFLKLTEQYMKDMNLDIAFFHFDPINNSKPGQLETANSIAEDYAKALPWLKAVFLDYGYKSYGYNYATSAFVSKVGVPVFHAMAPSRPWLREPDRVVTELQQRIGDQRPAFARVSLMGWTNTPSDIAYIMRQLPDDYVAVRGDQLGKLYLSWHKATSQQEAGEE